MVGAGGGPGMICVRVGKLVVCFERGSESGKHSNTVHCAPFVYCLPNMLLSSSPSSDMATKLLAGCETVTC
jgi:hypothetical protein